MEGAGIFTMLALLLMVPFQLWAQSQARWQMLNPVEQNLRRASQGIALAVFTGTAAFFLYGAAGIMRLLHAVFTDGRIWPGGVLACLFAYGLIRGLVGIVGAAGHGTRDPGRVAMAIVRIVIGLSIAGYLWQTSSLWQTWGTSAPGGMALMFAMAVGIWIALVGAIRLMVLMLPRKSDGIGNDIMSIGTNVGGPDWWKESEKRFKGSPPLR